MRTDNLTDAQLEVMRDLAYGSDWPAFEQYESELERREDAGEYDGPDTLRELREV